MRLELMPIPLCAGATIPSGAVTVAAMDWIAMEIAAAVPPSSPAMLFPSRSPVTHFR